MPSKRIRIGAPGYISASQVANLFGCGYGTPYDLYKRLKGEVVVVEVSDDVRKSLEFGTFFEDTVAKFAAAQKGFGKLVKCGTEAYFLEERPYFICHPDRLVKEKLPDGRRAAIEIKCVQPFAKDWGEEGTEDIPDVYYFQVQSYFACGVPCDVVFVCCMRGNRVYIYEIDPNWELIAEIYRRVDAFHQQTMKGIIPKSENYSEQISITGERVDWTAEAVPAGDEMLAKYTRLKELRGGVKALEDEEDALKRDILEFMGTSPALYTVEDGKPKRLATLSKSTRTSFDRKALEKDHPEIDYSPYEKKTESLSLRFSFGR